MFDPPPLSAPSGALAAEAARWAREGHLTIYGGAGISAAEPTCLPGAAGLAKRLTDALHHAVNLDGVDEWDLLAVADAVASKPRGDHLLQQMLLEVADLLSAPPSHAHLVLALLLCEGAITVLETNYDDCIERAAQPERLNVVRVDGDLLYGPSNALMKAHGCATRTDTMLITSQHLQNAPLWTVATVRAKLSSDLVIFVGIGSVADYVRIAIEAVLHAAGQEHLILVGPALSRWESEDPPDWKELLPDLPLDQLDASTADEFCDALLRAHFYPLRKAVNDVLGPRDEAPPARGLPVLMAPFEAASAAWLVRWLRDASWRHRVGTAVVHSTAAAHGLIGVGAMLTPGWQLELLPGGIAAASKCEDDPKKMYIAPIFVQEVRIGQATVDESRRRVSVAKARGEIPPNATVLVVAVGHIGSLGIDQVAVAAGDTLDGILEKMLDSIDLPADIVAMSTSDHLIDGPAFGRVGFVDAMALAAEL